jgi:hypothetical protein
LDWAALSRYTGVKYQLMQQANTLSGSSIGRPTPVPGVWGRGTNEKYPNE